MAKKTLILSQKQLDEITDGAANCAYLHDLALAPDKKMSYGNQVSADGNVDKGYADNTDTDDVASQLSNNSFWALGRHYGIGPVSVVREMTKKEFEELIAEENSKLKYARFGEHKRTYGALTQAKAKRKKAAAMANSQNPIEKQKGLNTLRNMDPTGVTEFENRKQLVKTNNSNTPKPYKSRNAGNGKGHHTKDGIIY